jgi:hypothetical protein
MTISADDLQSYCQGTLLQQFADVLRHNGVLAGVYHASNDTALNALASDIGTLQPSQTSDVSDAIKTSLDNSLLNILPAPQTEPGSDPSTWAIRFQLGLAVSIDAQSAVSLTVNGTSNTLNLPTPPDSSATVSA